MSTADFPLPSSGPKCSFPPVLGPGVRLLILGSLPGEKSLQAGRYYAHPRNQFWRLAGDVIERDLPALAYDDRLRALLDAGVGLWDVVASATRQGSLDGNIRDHRTNPLAEIAGSLPMLRAVGFNGGTAAKLGSLALAGARDLALLPLPSSSPAYTLPYDRKREAWLRLREFL